MRLATSLLARLGALVAAALTAAVTPFAASCAASIARVDIYDRTDQQTLDVHRHRGRQYVVGQPGNEYAIRIRNTTGGRVLAVVSVDGVNVVTGETAAPDQSGYVIEPGGYVNIQGWRKDLERTAAFYFSDPGDAYASRTGRPDDLGVIGVALFRERGDRWPYSQEREAVASPAAREDSSAAGAKASRDSTAAESNAAVPALGTGHGRREHSPVQRVDFERAGTRPDQRIVLRYDRRENLMAMGVLPKPEYRWREPNPFPGSLGFVPDP
jgi:hypothetical protein